MTIETPKPTVEAEAGQSWAGSALFGVPPKQPYICPVCGGKGKVRGGFYDDHHGYTTAVKQAETCKGCGGTGVIIC